MDGRKNNGNKGHSTKAKGADKRKNQYKDAVEQAASIEDVADVLKMLLSKAKIKQDVKAAQLFLEYTIGKPKQEMDINSTEGLSINFVDLIKSFGADQDS
jgi:hypothetical protein